MSERDIQGLFFSESEREHFMSEFFFSSLNNLSEAELSKVAKGLRTIVRRLDEAPIIFRFDFFSAKKRNGFPVYFFSASKEIVVPVYFFSASKERKERVGGSILKIFSF